MQGVTWIILFSAFLCAVATNLSHLPCNDKNVEKLARLALTYINEDRQTGYKFALNRIFNVLVHPQGPAGKIFYLDLDVLETKCHVLSPKSWTFCDIRPFIETQISGNCNATIFNAPDGFTYLHSYECTLVPDPPEKLQNTCPDCPLLLDVGNDIAVSSAKTTLHKYNNQSILSARLILGSITRASHQRFPVPACFVEYTVKESPVVPGEDVLSISVDPVKRPVGFCVGAVFFDGAVQAGINVSCEIFHPEHIGTSVGVEVRPHLGKISPARQKTSEHPVHMPKLQDTGPSVVNLAQQLNPPSPHSQSAPAPLLTSSESSESDSSEELVGFILRRPLDFHYIPQRKKRQTPVVIKMPQSPNFLVSFPSTTSPFRSCPGVSLYTTV